MKKYFFGLIIIILSYFIYVIFKPSNNKPIVVTVNCTNTAITRNVLDLKAWGKWWPGKKINDTSFSFDKTSFILKKLVVNGALFDANSGTKSESGFLQFESNNDTSCNLIWSSTSMQQTTLLEKLTLPFKKNIIKNNISSLLDSMKIYFNNPMNIYGFNAKMTKVSDPHLISIKKTYSIYPTTKEIYSTIQQLEDFAVSKGAAKTNAPMMNVHKIDGSNEMEVMIALPINIPLNAEGSFVPKFMIKGALLEAEVKGGAYTVEQCLSEFHNYLTDYKLSAPAIPYQSLITDRTKINDTSLWITKIYQPIFYR